MLKDAASFGALVRTRRRGVGFTQRDLAAVVNMGERFIVDLEAGKPTCQLGKALAVAHALGIVLADAGRRQEPSSHPDDDLPSLADLPGRAP